ncbi:fluoride efflux transporter CrcB [Geminicoccaceae bacterium 1502E]|nr:fluoride efflux transporter CrcB [Geminicoccaceae bacterium 1502E]
MIASTVWVALGGALGSVARFWLAELLAGLATGFPWATVLANLSGSFLIGLVATLTGPEGRLLVAPEIRQLVIVGICGGYTTFSSFSLQTLTLAQSGQWLLAAANVMLSVLGCLVAVWLGHVAALALDRALGG